MNVVEIMGRVVILEVVLDEFLWLSIGSGCKKIPEIEELLF